MIQCMSDQQSTILVFLHTLDNYFIVEHVFSHILSCAGLNKGILSLSFSLIQHSNDDQTLTDVVWSECCDDAEHVVRSLLLIWR